VAWLLELVSEVSSRLGEASVGYTENGEVFVHSDLARELEKPGRELLSEMLIAGARANAREVAEVAEVQRVKPREGERVN
jgi:hypothetical protein